jgi:CBS domain-containing protein
MHGEQRMAKVSEVLSGKGRSVWAVAPDQPVFQALELMAAKGIGAVLVMRDGRLAGILSERDYARKVALKGRTSADTPVAEIMSDAVVTVTPDDTVDTCMMLMTERKIRHLPVVDAGHVVGVLSIGDLVKSVIDAQQREIAELQRYIVS